MKIIVACSKKWFKIDQLNIQNNEFFIIKNKKDLSFNKVKLFDPDYIFFPHWSWLVPKNIVEHFNCILFHTAPLPFGRGGSPIQNLILRGFKRSPVCALKMTSVIDAGPIYGKKIISLDGSLSQIFRRINKAINKLIYEITIKNLKPINQNGKIVNFKRLKNEDNQIPKDATLKKIYDYVRMLDHPEYPNAFMIKNNQKFEFSSAKFKNGELITKCKISKC